MRLFIRTLSIGCLFFLLVPHATAHEISGSVVVHMTKDGYSPSKIELTVGQKVIFENVDSVPHWPASNIHPTHEIYPEFDPQKPVKPRESWEFVFTKGGNWRYHDHLWPKVTGMITVKGDASESSSVVSKSRVPWNELLKWQIPRLYYRFFSTKLDQTLNTLNMHEVANEPQKLRYWVGVLGGEKVMQELVSDSGGGSLVDCHQEAHETGRTAYMIYGAAVFRENHPECHSGFIHGAMEEFLKEKGTENISQNILALCKNFSTGFSVFECFHGVGHGVMAYVDYDLPTALATCKDIQDDFAKSSCYGGVFMENIVVAQGQGAKRGHETAWVNKDPHFPCNTLENDAAMRRECYLMQTSWMLTLFNYDLEKVGPECVRASADMKETCFKSLGRDIAGQTLRDPLRIVGACEKIPELMRYFDVCIGGSLNVIVDFWGEKLEDQASQLCRLLVEPHKITCYQNLAGRLPEIFPDAKNRENVCQTFEPDYQKWCSSK